MRRKSLLLLLRGRFGRLSPASVTTNKMQSSPADGNVDVSASQDGSSAVLNHGFDGVLRSMHSAISLNKTEILDAALDDFAEGYCRLYIEPRRALLLTLAKEYDLNRTHVRELMKQYLELELPTCDDSDEKRDLLFSSFYGIERNLRLSLKPMYEDLFERLNTHPGGLRFLSIMRADLLSFLKEESIASLMALDSYLKEKLITWLSPANLQLNQITWNDSASLLEKIVTYEAVHPISNLLDLKRRLGVGRRCFGYFHPAIPGEPLIFIEVALMKDMAQTIQEVLWDEPPIPEFEAACALFYSISSTQPGLSGINLGKFLIKRVIDLVRRDMQKISIFATLSPIPGFMEWLMSILTSDKAASASIETLLNPEEEAAVLDASGEFGSGKTGMEVMQIILSSSNYVLLKSETFSRVLRAPLMRLCARYLLQEKKRGKSLDSVGNFHLQNGAMLGRINWMADKSEKGLKQSAGMMVNYIYELDHIEENAQSYFSKGQIQASDEVKALLE